MSFDQFAQSVTPRLRAALVAAYGVDIGSDAAAEAMAYAWEHWDRVGEMGNPAGYLYRVGQTAARRLRRPERLFRHPVMVPESISNRGFCPHDGWWPSTGRINSNQWNDRCDRVADREVDVDRGPGAGGVRSHHGAGHLRAHGEE